MPPQTRLQSCIRCRVFRRGGAWYWCCREYGPTPPILPARSAGCLRVRGYDRHAGFGQIVPVLDIPGITPAYQQDDGRRVGRAVMRQPLLPVHRNPLCFFCDFINVVGQSQCHHVGIQPIDDGSGLFSGTAVRLLERDLFPDFFLPVLAKRRVELLIELTRRIIGGIQ